MFAILNGDGKLLKLHLVGTEAFSTVQRRSVVYHGEV